MAIKIEQIVGKEKYFVHKGTWLNNYEWRIEKVKIRGVEIDDKGKLFVKFGFSCCGYEYPLSYMRDSLEAAKRFAISQINREKKKQLEQIKAIPINKH